LNLHSHPLLEEPPRGDGTIRRHLFLPTRGHHAKKEKLHQQCNAWGPEEHNCPVPSKFCSTHVQKYTHNFDYNPTPLPK